MYTPAYFNLACMSADVSNFVVANYKSLELTKPRVEELLNFANLVYKLEDEEGNIEAPKEDEYIRGQTKKVLWFEVQQVIKSCESYLKDSTGTVADIELIRNFNETVCVPVMEKGSDVEQVSYVDYTLNSFAKEFNEFNEATIKSDELLNLVVPELASNCTMNITEVPCNNYAAYLLNVCKFDGVAKALGLTNHLLADFISDLKSDLSKQYTNLQNTKS